MSFDFSVKQLSTEEALKKEEDFVVVQLRKEPLDDAWEQMHGYFETATAREDKLFRSTFFRWYTDISWRLLNIKSVDFLVDIAISRQLVVALLLDIDVWIRMMRYLTINVPDDKQQMTIVYRKMKNAFFSSQQYVGTEKEKDITLKDLIDEVLGIERRGNNSLEIAEFNTRIKNIVFPKQIGVGEENLYQVSPDVFISRLKSLIAFFTGVDEANIYYIVDSVLHPFSHEDHGEVSEKIEKSNESTVDQAGIYKKISEQLKTKFTLGADGQFENIEGVIGYLDELATAQQNEKIRDLYVFNENTGMFEWNEQLLSETI